jgi:hypothetical protein
VVPVIVAVISGPIVVVLQRLRKENTEQHAENGIMLRSIGRRVDKIGDEVHKISGELREHLGWHNGQEDAK